MLRLSMSAFALRNLVNNSRFYLLGLALLASIAIACGLRLTVESTQLWYIRTEQVYGFVALGAVYAALILTPISKLVGKRPIMRLLLFSRRAIGVSAFYFAVLHGGFALYGQLGGWAAISVLPERFIIAFGLGAGALLVLFMLAATSFDRIIVAMTFRRWKWLHRLVYIAGILLILHVWMIGTHTAEPLIMAILFGLLVVFFGLESWRMAQVFAARFKEFQSKDYLMIMFVGMWLSLTVALACVPALTGNYHTRHTSGAEHGHAR
jgi:DMSO/TMAO reductase YedYZ heme-binding membrane subunit